jgi:hypothetical protein
MATSKVQVFYRVVKAQKGHPFSGLYGVEKVFIKDNTIYKKELVHEWDLRLISEAVLAKLGGSAAYDSYAEDHEIEDTLEDPRIVEAKARTKEELKNLTQRKLNSELKGPK